MKNTQRGFLIPLVIVIIAAAAVGGGVYYSKNKASSTETKQDTTPTSDMNHSAEGDVSANAQVNANVNLGGTGKGTLRSLFAMTKDTVCTYKGTNAQGSVSGTMYISGNMMRGDFTTTGQGEGAVDSHMIKNGDTVFAWTGNQGAKMDMKMLESKSADGATASQQNGLDLNQNVEYDCKDWTKDASKFTPPTSVTFMDIAAMMKTNTNINLGR